MAEDVYIRNEIPDRGRIAIIGVMMTVIAFVTPFAYRIDIVPGPNSIRAMLWDYIKASWYSGFRLWNPLDTIPYTLLRMVFAYQIARYYSGKGTKKQAISIGVASELQPLFVSVPLTYGIQLPGDPHVPLYIPIPIMLALAILVLLLVPRLGHSND